MLKREYPRARPVQADPLPETKKKASVQSVMDRVVRRIVRRFHPEQVILFGSRARRDAGPESDIDLLVVMDFEGSKLDKMVELQGAADDAPVPVDILVTTPADFAWRKDVVGTIEWPAYRQGKIIYARS